MFFIKVKPLKSFIITCYISQYSITFQMKSNHKHSCAIGENDLSSNGSFSFSEKVRTYYYVYKGATEKCSNQSVSMF